MKTAIIYYSMSGNTAYVADLLKKQLDSEATLIEIKPVKAFPDSGFKKFFWGGKSAVMGEKPKLCDYPFDADEYDQIIIGFPVWAGRVAPPIRTFVEDNKTALGQKKIAAFACQSGSGAEKALDGLKKLIGITDFQSEMILIDPKEKPNKTNEENIDAFCEVIKS